MAGYLRRYVGIYVVKAEYDLNANDYPRLHGDIDPSFDDLYIKCNGGAKIIHQGKDVLMCYIPSKRRGINVIRELLDLSVEVDVEDFLKNHYNSDLIFNAELLDFEVCFSFKSKNIEQIIEVVGYPTRGCDNNPFSVKNLPKSDYKIPQSDLDKLKEILPKFTEENSIDYMRNLKVVNDVFREKVQKKKGKKFDFGGEMKKSKMKFKQFIHSLGLWEEYLEFVKKNFEV